MFELNLQYFGGRGSGSDLSNSGSGENIDIRNRQDIWSYRHNPDNADFVDSINNAIDIMQDDFKGVMDFVKSVVAGNLVGRGSSRGIKALGCYGDGEVAMNLKYTDVQLMNEAMDRSFRNGYHPSRGSYNGVEAVTFHEMGHALSDYLASKMGVKDLDKASEIIVKNAYKASKGKGGTEAWAKNISRYATKNNAECVAEACADWYCNGAKASPQARAIVKEMIRINGLKR